MNRSRLFRFAARACGLLSLFIAATRTPADPAKARQEKPAAKDQAKPSGLPEGTAKIWEDRGSLTPAKVYWGVASLTPDPMSRLPVAPFSHFEIDTNGTSPKGKVRDSKDVKWTAKFGEEVHSDVAAPRLAWALGFGAVEGYYVDSGKIEGVNEQTNLGSAKVSIKPDGSFQGGARFKRRDKEAEPVKNAKGEDVDWDEGHNPGVPPEQLSGLLIFDVLVNNWDAQTKNCKVYHVEGAKGPENWYIVSDMGASFAGQLKHKFDLKGYQKEGAFIQEVEGDHLELKFSDAIRGAAKLHQRIPLAHAQWFRKQLEKLTDDDIQAAFDAAFATEGLNKAYVTGDAAQIKAAREKELSEDTRAEIAAFVTAFRAKITEFLQKVPAGS